MEGPDIGIAGLGMYVPPQVVTADQLASETGIPAGVLRQKFGIQEVHRAGPDCHVSHMAAEAGRDALADAGVSPDEVDLVLYCGSEFKDYIVWSAATRIAHLLGCRRAQAFEIYALCAGAPIALRVARDIMRGDPEISTTLIVASSKESALIDRRNRQTRFMFNFGDGAGAAVLRRGLDRNVILGSTSVVDGSLSEDVVMPVGGSRGMADGLTDGWTARYLEVADLGHMRRRLDEVSGQNFLRVVRTALQQSRGEQNTMLRVDFLAPVHMKRSMHRWLVDAVQAERAFYLEEYGHMQAADQFVALKEGRRRGLLHEGDTVVLVAAGVGYTWAATVLAWGPQA